MGWLRNLIICFQEINTTKISLRDLSMNDRDGVASSSRDLGWLSTYGRRHYRRRYILDLAWRDGWFDGCSDRDWSWWRSWHGCDFLLRRAWRPFGAHLSLRWLLKEENMEIFFDPLGMEALGSTFRRWWGDQSFPHHRIAHIVWMYGRPLCSTSEYGDEESRDMVENVSCI